MDKNGRHLFAYAMGINTHQEPVVYMREDCPVCRAEGFNATSRILIRATNNKELIATLNIVDSNKLPSGNIGLSRIAQRRLDVGEGDMLVISQAPIVLSLGAVRKKIHGHALDSSEIDQIIVDINDHKYSDIEIASFLSVCAGDRLNLDEIISLTRAMVACGEHIEWPSKERIFDKHCIGGLPGNRTTPLVVAIASAAGLTVPKTSSRSITSPSGTADTMDTLMNVNLTIDQIRQVVAKTDACLAWGGAVNLSPADDLMIRIERALDLDVEGQLIASVLSKKIAAGSTHAIIDIPVGETAKVRNQADADRLAWLFTEVGKACDLYVRCLITDGSRPIGAGIGPAEEARDLLAVLKGQADAPADLTERALFLAAHLLDMAYHFGYEAGLHQARSILESGQAWAKFQSIAAAQGGLKPLPSPHYRQTIHSARSGIIHSIDNRRLARLAKLAGAPFDPAAGLRLSVNIGSQVSKGDPLFELFSESPGELAYALSYYQANMDLFHIE